MGGCAVCMFLGAKRKKGMGGCEVCWKEWCANGASAELLEFIPLLLVLDADGLVHAVEEIDRDAQDGLAVSYTAQMIEMMSAARASVPRANKMPEARSQRILWEVIFSSSLPRRLTL